MNRLKELRLSKGLTQDAVASELKITRPAYTLIENGNRQLGIDALVTLSNYYDVTVGYLLGVEPLDTKKEKQPTAQGDELDNALVAMLMDLTPQDVQRVLDFVEGLKAARREPSSQNP